MSLRDHAQERVDLINLTDRARLPPFLSHPRMIPDDGRVTFTSPGVFKASFTLGGDAPHDQWYLVDFSFDFQGRDGELQA